MASGIYKIIDKRNNKIYIGRAVDLNNRKWKHFCFLYPEKYSKTSLEAEWNMPIHQAMIKSHNKNDFTFEVLEECDKELLDQREQYYIAYYNSMIPNGYNKTKGGSTFSHSQGKNHYHHIISQKEANQIKKYLQQGLSVKEIQKFIPRATIGIISSINNGYSWKDNNIIYPISSLNGVKKFSNADVIDMRTMRKEGVSVTEIAKKYNTRTCTISAITTGQIRKDCAGEISQKQIRNIFTEKEVEYYREYYTTHNITIADLWRNYISKTNNQISYGAFRDMVNGITYKQYKNFEKEKIKKIDNKKQSKIDRNNLIKQLIQEGTKSKQEIAKIIGCSERTVYRVIKQNEI